uniref:Uncharacterized protein n=1 Tax=Timema genevievae TaxID=629358 RepID=A0A7R9PLM2_TIMGE|nr:unnamed protein product [Timema genevievae]
MYPDLIQIWGESGQFQFWPRSFSMFIALFSASILATMNLGLAADTCEDSPCSGDFNICVDIDLCKVLEPRDRTNDYRCLTDDVETCMLECAEDETSFSMFIALFSASILATMNMGLAADNCKDSPCSGDFNICVDLNLCTSLVHLDNETPELPEDKILIFTDHLDQLKTDMESRFEDLTKLQIPDWILDPFSFEAVDKLDNSLQTEFLVLKYDCEAKIIFKQSGYELVWVKLMNIYPQLWGKTEPLLISFPSTDLVEKGFSSVVQLLTKQRNKLDISLKGDFRLNLMNIKPDIQALTEIHQAQGSHRKAFSMFIALFNASILATMNMGLAADTCKDSPCSGDFSICVDINLCKVMEYWDRNNDYICLKDDVERCMLDCEKDETCASTEIVNRLSLQACIKNDNHNCTNYKMLF